MRPGVVASHNSGSPVSERGSVVVGSTSAHHREAVISAGMLSSPDIWIRSMRWNQLAVPAGIFIPSANVSHGTSKQKSCLRKSIVGRGSSAAERLS